MKKGKMFKNKTQMIIYIIIFIICIGLFIYVGNINFTNNSETEAKKFSNIYNLVPENNLFVFSKVSDVLNIINGRSGVVLMGFPSNEWTNYYASFLNEIALELNIDKIYYYDFLQDRDSNNGTYETVVNKLESFVPTFDNKSRNIQAPSILIVKNGKIIAYLDDTAIIKGNITPKDYYTDNQIEITKEAIKTALLEYIY